MKRSLYTLLVISTLTVHLNSCTSQLEEDARSSIPVKNFFTNEEECNSAVIGIYNYIKAPYNKYGYDEMPYAMLELPTGMFDNKAQWQFASDYVNLKFDATSPDFSIWWESCYKGIEAANSCLRYIPAVNMSENKKNELLAEASFLRAYFYFQLVHIFGDVPLKMVPTANPGDALIGKSPVRDIFEKAIIPDLKFAEEQPLAATTQGNGRVSVMAVKTLLAKTYLSMAGLLNDNSFYGLAKTKALEVIQSNKHKLFESDQELTWFNKLNNPTFDNKEEHIFMANYAINNANSSLPVYFLPKEVKLVNALQFGGFSPSSFFLDAYDAADLRGRHNQGFFMNTLQIGDEKHEFPWAIYKFMDPGILTTAPNSAKNFPLLRYADLLMVYSEAQNEADGSPDKSAIDAVNQIRNRSGLPDISKLSQAEFREEVQKQRYFELCAEGKIWFDMVRTKKIFDTKTNKMVDLIGFKLPSGAIFKEENLKFPIPSREVQINPLLK
ncbi:RagB/SusD family nutrient uptake outer membrane protein [Sphingobacterium sp. ML3W]|uniref:RagB/SusD family nutrient uptake outer membrane protein n=1 Tax=Sphingobacterium sp. ML3W TaxID=1538644 RepID=UPI00068FF2CE|nr:RagB/SusD family nutrient uptake outer membrane protein [Sphingobacterium sp. ML3W]